MLVIQISRQCSEQILARQREEFKGKRAKLRKGILKMKSSDDGREMSFRCCVKLVWIPPARNGEYNLKYEFNFKVQLEIPRLSHLYCYV